MILKQVKRFYDQGEYELAMDIALRGETETRDAIPGEIWLKMGGMLTSTGREKLKARREKGELYQ